MIARGGETGRKILYPRQGEAKAEDRQRRELRNDARIDVTRGDLGVQTYGQVGVVEQLAVTLDDGPAARELDLGFGAERRRLRGDRLLRQPARVLAPHAVMPGCLVAGEGRRNVRHVR